MALWLIVYIAFRTPPVQRWVTGKISDQLSKQLNTKVSLDGLDIDWFDEVVLDGVYVEDQQQDTLLYVEKFRVNIEPWALFNKTVNIRLVEAIGLYANLYQLEEQEDLNFAFISEAFASEDPQPEDTTSSSWTIDLYKVHLNNIRFDYDAEGTEMNLALNRLVMLFDKLGLEESHIQGDELDIDGLHFAMLLPPDSPANSAAADSVASDTTQTEDVLNPSGFAYSLNELEIDSSQITYRVKQPGTADDKQLNFEDLTLNNLQTRIEDLHVGANDIALYLQNLAFTEANSGFELNKLEARADVNMPQVKGELLNLETSHSQLNGTVRASVTLADDMQELIESLKVDSELSQAVLGLADAAYFTDALDSLPAVRNLSPRLTWRTHIANGDGKVENLLFNIEDSVKMQANLTFSNLGAIDSSSNESPYFDLHLQELSADMDFIRQFTSDSIGQYLQKTNSDKLLLTAEAEGTLNDIQANAELQSGLGSIVTSANYAVNQNNSVANIDAQIAGQQLDIRQVMKLLGNPDSVANAYDKLTFHATADAQTIISARDTTISRADIKLTVNRFDYNDYTYQDLTLSSLLIRDSLQAEIAYQDSLLELHANAQASLNTNNPVYAANLQLKNANLFRLNLVPDSVIITNILLQANARGNNADDIVGFVKVLNADIIKDDGRYLMDSLLLSADKDGNNRTFTLSSDKMNAEITGKFDLNTLPVAIEDFQQYYLAGNELPGTNLDTISTNDAKYQQLAFTFSIDSTPALALAFVPELNIPVPITAEGSFDSRDRSLSLDINAPHITYGENAVDSLYINARTNERRIEIDMSTRYIKSGGITIPKFLFTGEVSGVSEKSVAAKEKFVTTQLDFNMKMGQGNSPYRVDLDAKLQSRQDTTILILGESELVLRDQAWQFSKDAQLVYAENYLDISDFSLKQNEQEIFITTDNSGAGSDLKLAISQLAIGPFLDAFDMEDYGVKGVIQGEALINNMFKPGPIQANLAINNLEVRNQDIGDFKLEAEKNSPESSGRDLLGLLITLQGPNNDLTIEGNYNLAADSNNIDLQLDLNKLQLKPWQVFAEDLIKTLTGTLQANLTITGSPTDPIINGNLAVADEIVLQTTLAGATHYIPEQNINFGGKTVQFNDFTLLDSARNQATLSGNVNFTELTDPTVDLSFNTEDFLLVKSEKYENEEFYGRAIATADVEMEGRVSNLDITGELGVDEGTDMVIALVSADAEAAQAGFIEFVNTNAFLAADSVSADSVEIASSAGQEDTVSVSGFNLSTTIHINPEARFTIMIDPVNGDKVVASGEADLRVDMNPSGDMGMQGTYELVSGSYNLSFAGLVQKEFGIREGSTITWTGDPANAELDMTAVYTTETSLEDLLAAYRDALTTEQLRAASTEQEVNVLLGIAGTIEAPELSFDIEVPALSSGGANIQLVEDVINQVKQNETELYKQVFGLIVLNRFIPTTGGFGSSEGGGLAGGINEKIDNSVSRLLSSQLSSLSEDYLGGVEINVGLQQADQTQQSTLADRDLNVELSKSLFNDRLTVSVGGVTTLQTGQGGVSAGNSGEVMAQFEVLYRVDKAGNLNVRIFQSPRRDPLTNNFEQNAGVSLFYQKSFDELIDKGEILTSRPRGGEVEEEEEEDDQNIQSQDAAIEGSPRRKKGGK